MSDGKVEESADPKRAWTPDEEAIFHALASGETVVSAAAKGGLAQTTYYDHRRADPEFAAQCDRARRAGTDRRADELEAVLHEGATKASEDARFTTQLIFALKNMRPSVWRDSHEISGPGGSAIPVQIVQFGGRTDDSDDTNGEPAAD